MVREVKIGVKGGEASQNGALRYFGLSLFIVTIFEVTICIISYITTIAVCLLWH